MKKISVLHLFILFASCATNPKKLVEQNKSLENQLNAATYTLTLPENWHPYLDLHNELSYKPVKYQEKYPEVEIYIRSTPADIPLNKLVDERIQIFASLSDYSKKISQIQSKFGETYIVDEKFKLNMRNYVNRTTYFEYKGEYYHYNYSSIPRLFNKYIDDYASIFESLEFKE
ncbi:MAG: hypothetical protein DSY83_12050 [Flavobacteriia bacterium]|uniref:Gliding motility lipoprotein GldD n=1 Tax=Flagellimonas hadalis TaxID=2597517 RepID=A0A5N5IX49_9FLAO|nr:hypothetical protein FOT42_001830 [Allomuricauda hadalis]RUA13173.1 MAG: hypothetical protein DSY83_12050 [Flavobacteriia bacterium]